jgi:hypothetical protein
VPEQPKVVEPPKPEVPAQVAPTTTAPAQKIEEEKQPEAAPALPPPEKLIEITGKPAMSDAELKKLEELRRLKREEK